jgi:Flp pilus assembly protein CpaB
MSGPYRLFWLATVAACLLCGCQHAAAPPIETVTVLVARQNIPASTLIAEPEKLFKQVQIAKVDARGVVTEFEELSGKTLLLQALKDQPVKRAFAAALPVGMRAIVVKIFLDMAIAGMILPGSYVDLVHVVDRVARANTRSSCERSCSSKSAQLIVRLLCWSRRTTSRS